MKTKTLIFPVIYSAIYISAMCIAFYGGYINHINKVSITGWLLIVPFTVLAMIYAKRMVYANQIGGKNAVKEGLKFVVISTIILIIFQTIFFTLDFKEYKVDFIKTYGIDLAKTQIKNGHLKITESEIPSLIQKEIDQVTIYREITSIIFKNIFLGTITSVICAVILRIKR